MVSSERGGHVLNSVGSHYIILFTSREESEFCTKVVAVFREFLKVMTAGPSSIHRLAWNTTTNCMDFLQSK